MSLKNLIGLTLGFCLLPQGLLAANLLAEADMMREDRKVLEHLHQPNVELQANVVQPSEIDSSECLPKDEQLMKDGDPGKYSCMEGYENKPQIDIGDFDTKPDGEHPIFEDRMGGPNN